MARSAGVSHLFVSAFTRNGYTLQRHARDPALHTMLTGPRHWNAVVLQEQSRLPATGGPGFSNGTRALCRLVRQHNPDVHIFLLETWARHPALWLTGRRLPGRNATDMQQRLTNAYIRTALKNHAGVAAVGHAWKLYLDSSTPVRLHADDGAHPDETGTCLAALVLTGALLGVDRMERVTDFGALPTDVVAAFRDVARRTLLERW
jgi:hypothetical protein